MAAADRVLCPRCGESLPSTLERCDACGAYLGARGAAATSAQAAAHAGLAPAAGRPDAGRERRPDRSQGRASGKAPARREAQGIPGIAWLLLVVGLVVGGMVGFVLHSSIGPRAEEGMPTGPSDIMAGSGGAGEGGMPSGGGIPPMVKEEFQAYKAALAKNPNDLDANIGLGNLEFDSAHWMKAIEYYSRALAVDPKNADVRVDRAIAYHGNGQNDLAQAELKRVTKESPGHKNAWLNLGVVAREAGDRATAVRAWERYLELEPSGERSNQIRQELATLKQIP